MTSAADIQKSDIHTIKILGEGAFGIVDLVVVDAGASHGHLLCVRKKLLKHRLMLQGAGM